MNNKLEYYRKIIEEQKLNIFESIHRHREYFIEMCQDERFKYLLEIGLEYRKKERIEKLGKRSIIEKPPDNIIKISDIRSELIQNNELV